MMITNTLWISKKRDKSIATNITGKPEIFREEPQYSALLTLYRNYTRKWTTEEARLSSLKNAMNVCGNISQDDHNEIDQRISNLEIREKITDALGKIQRFFSEFSFTPNFRFINTFVHLNGDYKAICSYVSNYFALTDNTYKTSIDDKMKSIEWKELCNDFTQISTTKCINKRFKLYYGAQGTGKTTIAMQEANNNCMICHSAMLPSDLMEDFAFDDGKATFRPSQLCKAMTEGKKIVLDEINLLPFESLRFLQSILDGKESFVYKGQTIKIEDGFEIIGTMNLQVNGAIYSLPEPLVDRAFELKEFILTPEQLIGAIL